jgi:hypothetical protein
MLELYPKDANQVAVTLIERHASPMHDRQRFVGSEVSLTAEHGNEGTPVGVRLLLGWLILRPSPTMLLGEHEDGAGPDLAICSRLLDRIRDALPGGLVFLGVILG